MKFTGIVSEFRRLIHYQKITGNASREYLILSAHFASASHEIILQELPAMFTDVLL